MLLILINPPVMAPTQPPISADPNSDEFKEVYQVISGLLTGLFQSERYESNLIIEATDQAVTDFEDGIEQLREAKERSAGRARA